MLAHAPIARPLFACRGALAVVAAFALGACASKTTPVASTTSAAASASRTADVSLTYLGVAGWQMTDGAHALLVDPFFSRRELPNMDAIVTSDPAALDRYAPARADVILVGHSHYDHLLDVPAIAKRTGAIVIGSESTANVLRAAGVAEDHARVVRGGETLAEGAFTIRVMRGLHSLTGQADAPIPREVTLPMAAKGYAEGGTLQYLVRFEGRSVLFIGTANLVDRELDGLRPDVAVIAVGLSEKIPDYACRLMRALGRPPLVLTNHFDAHWAPLGPEQMDISDEGRAHLATFAEEIHACAPDTKVVVPVHFQPISI